MLGLKASCYAPVSGPYILQIWSVNYTSCFGHFPIYGQCLYYNIPSTVNILRHVQKFMNYYYLRLSFGIFWRIKKLLLCNKKFFKIPCHIFVLFLPKNIKTNYLIKTVTWEWWGVESCPILCWIAFLMLYWLLYNTSLSFRWRDFVLKCLVSAVLQYLNRR